jgi:hypothetical protein
MPPKGKVSIKGLLLKRPSILRRQSTKTADHIVMEKRINILHREMKIMTRDLRVFYCLRNRKRLK